jgi:glucose-1-phosphate cytidylyltransferase
MKVVILAGGRGTRLSEETSIKPKPLVEAGGKPLIWHIMQNYAQYGFTDFIILVGYKGDQIRNYFANFWINQSDVTFDLSSPNFNIHKVRSLPWKVSVIETGIDTSTGSRLSKIANLVDEDFMLTYGDGVSDVDINQLLKIYKENSSLVTLTAVQPPARFGALNLVDKVVKSFEEKPSGDGSWVNGGFFVMNKKIFHHISTSDCSLESDVLPTIALSGRLTAYKHKGFWQPVDTVRDLFRLEQEVSAGKLPWL